jgi:hypothetical protein
VEIPDIVGLMLGADAYSPRGERLTDPELPIIKDGERKSKWLGIAIRIEFGGGQLQVNRVPGMFLA